MIIKIKKIYNKKKDFNFFRKSEVAQQLIFFK